jgi:uncharacterized protein (DUF2336 family)
MGNASALIAELEDAIQGNQADKRTILLRRVTDLFVRRSDAFADEHVALFDDVLVRLADGIEATARAELSERLAPLANAPIKIVEALSTDDNIAVAGPVLSQSERLADTNLVAIINTKSQEHILAISKRQHLECLVTDALVERGDGDVVRTVAKNAGAQFSDAGFGMLVRRSWADEFLAEMVGVRRDLPAPYFEKLIAAASSAVRTRLAHANPHLADQIHDILARITEEARTAAERPRDYTAATDAVKALSASNKLGEAEVASFAQNGRFEETAVALATICQVPLDAVERAFVGHGAEPVLILARSADFSWETTRLVLRLCSSGAAMTSEERDSAHAHFDKLQVATAQRVLRFYKVRQAVATPP